MRLNDSSSCYKWVGPNSDQGFDHIHAVKNMPVHL